MPKSRTSQDLCVTLLVARSVASYRGQRAPALHRSATCEISLREGCAWIEQRTEQRAFRVGACIPNTLFREDFVFRCCLLRPQLLRPPTSVVARCIRVPCVSESPALLWVAEVGLLDDIWD